MKKNGSLSIIVPFLKTKNASVLKQFEEDQWRQFDGPAKNAAIIFWTQHKYSCVENPDEFGVDLLVECRGKKSGCKVEVKTKWFGAEFEFPTLHIAFRKRKFMGAPCQFMVLDCSLTHPALVSHKTIMKSPLVEIRNANAPSGESLYDVPVSAITIVNMLV